VSEKSLKLALLEPLTAKLKGGPEGQISPVTQEPESHPSYAHAMKELPSVAELERRSRLYPRSLSNRW
jgi:hypothetical protein